MRRMRSTSAALVAIGSLACLGAALIVALAGCPNTASTSIYTPPTGIQINSQDLVMGVGCGSGPGQVYRYAAVVGPAEKDGGYGIGPGTLITSGVFDCFSDALFANLPQPDGGPTDYGIDIFAWNRDSFPSELGGCEDLPLATSCTGDDASVVMHYSTQATWTTQCRDTQSQGVPQVADCEPLAPAGRATGSDAGDAGDAGEAGDATTSGDATSEAADAPAEGTDGPTAEASDGAGVSGEGGDAPLE